MHLGDDEFLVHAALLCGEEHFGARRGEEGLVQPQEPALPVLLAPQEIRPPLVVLLSLVIHSFD